MNQGGDQGRSGPQNQRPGNVRPGTGPDFGNLPPQRGKIIRQVVADFAADVSNVLNATIPRCSLILCYEYEIGVGCWVFEYYAL
nr:hypothetical protein CFP56_17319 [Quercus suber]